MKAVHFGSLFPNPQRNKQAMIKKLKTSRTTLNDRGFLVRKHSNCFSNCLRLRLRGKISEMNQLYTLKTESGTGSNRPSTVAVSLERSYFLAEPKLKKLN